MLYSICPVTSLKLSVLTTVLFYGSSTSVLADVNFDQPGEYWQLSSGEQSFPGEILHVGNSNGDASLSVLGAESGTDRGSLIFGAVKVGDASGGSLLVDNGASLQALGYLQLGNQNGTGVLTVNNNAVVSANVIDVGSSGSGRLIVDNGASVHSSGYLYIGYSEGSGEMLVDNGATVDASFIGTGIGNNASGLMLVDNGASVKSTGYTEIGSQNGVGIMKLDNSAKMSTQYVTSVGSGGEGTLILDHEAAFSSGRLNVGNDNGLGSVTVSNGADLNVDSGIYLYSGALNIGAEKNGEAQKAGTIASSGDPFLNSSGINLYTDNITGMSGEINFNHTDSNYSFASDISGTGNVNILAGTTTLTGINDYYGTTAVESGVLKAGLEQAFSHNSDFTVSSDGILDLNSYDQTIASLSNGGTVYLNQSLQPSAPPGTMLIVNGNYHGDGGQLVFSTALGDDESQTDHMTVTGDTSGTTHVRVNNAGGNGAQTLEGIELIRVGGNSDGEFVQSGRIVAGAYDYNLLRGNGQNSVNWYLSSTLAPEPETELPPSVVPDEPLPPVEPGEPPVTSSPLVRPEAGLYGMNLYAANTLFAHRLHDRLGETHYVDVLTGENAVTSLWMRNAGGHTRSRDSSGQLKMQSNRYVLQLGSDVAQWSSDDQDRYHLGVMAGYASQKSRSHSNITGYRADASIDGYSVGIYGTWVQNNDTQEGAYVDTWALYNWFDNTVSGESISTEKYKSRGFTGSVEAGYTWKLADISERNALFIQPKAQATWMGVKADSHTESNGTRVEGNGDDNVQTRLGVRLYGHGHNKIDDGKARTFQPFVEANWVHNTKNFGASLNGELVEMGGTRNIGELKTGIEGQLTENVSLWGNVAQQVGDKGYSDTSAMMGIKMSF